MLAPRASEILPSPFEAIEVLQQRFLFLATVDSGKSRQELKA
jgi:hypothetical protein